MLPGSIGGYLQQALGYPIFFVLVCSKVVPGMLTVLFIPFDRTKM